MKRQAFADLCGVSKQMIAKYAAAGLIVEADGSVDAGASLAALDGRLDEGRRQAALTALAGTPALREPQPIEKSAKTQRDEVDLALRQLQLGREAGQLVSVEAVDEAARQAVAKMREAFGNRNRGIAERLCVKFDLAPEKATPLALFIGKEFEATLGVFAEEMAGIAGPSAARGEPGSHAAHAAAV